MFERRRCLNFSAKNLSSCWGGSQKSRVCDSTITSVRLGPPRAVTGLLYPLKKPWVSVVRTQRSIHVIPATHIWSIAMDIGKLALGVVGGGQLGRMMAWPAHRLSVKLVCLDAAGADAPCAQVRIGKFDRRYFYDDRFVFRFAAAM